MNKADSAEELFRMGYNCSQSVYAAFAEDLGMSVEEAAKRASPFGAGFGKLREVCGAVSGMVLVWVTCAGTKTRRMLRENRRCMRWCSGCVVPLRNRRAA